MDDYIRAARPRVQRLSRELELEAIRLLAELLADAAKEHRDVLPGAFKRRIRGPMPGAKRTADTPDSPHGLAKRQRSQRVTKGGKSMPNAMSTRPARIGSAFAWEVTKHTTERDREIAWLLYRQKILTTDQIRLLFFGSLRRCQDRLLWLYRHRVIDRFYPAGPFSLGKPQAHWLLDEVGAHLVAARLGRARKSLGWDRQQDFHEHAQLAHRLECNRFVCSVITATLDTPDVWVAAWEPGWGAIKPHWSIPPYESARPDASFTVSTPLGLVAVAVEWDRATEPMATLVGKIRRYQLTLERSPVLA